MIALPTAIKTMFDAWTSFDRDGYVGAFADKFRESDPYGETTSRESLAEHARITELNWKAIDYRVTDLVANGGKIAIAYTAELTGKENAPWEGKAITLKCMAFVGIIDDRIASWDELFDTGVLRRTGRK